ncbi:MAG: prepilin-type N-terminal cleavage/methylation domain-containing protein [Candidatus Sumerlaeia bacterium]|nr:prepilin-type N-terminal cleavage/methylation domain-containing protein [Candidatus Sumerlaeia bacterium]
MAPEAHKKRARQGLTLIELLVVVSILAILAAIAIPNLLEAQTRSRVSAAKATIRTGIVALEMYAVDNSRYPPMRQMFPNDPLGLLASEQLRVLSTPVAYVSSSRELTDPFGTIQLRGPSSSPPVALSNHADASGFQFPELRPPNQHRSLLYYHFPTLANRFNEPRINLEAVGLVSIGPDLRDSLGAFALVPAPVFQARFARGGLLHPYDTIYDPTNGTVSEGDIQSFAGVMGKSPGR